MDKQIIGIIGGAGVAATNLLNTMVEEEITSRYGATRDCDHPEIISWQLTSAPSRSMYYEGRGETFIPQYVKAAKILKDIGAKLILMNCNTAHCAFNEIKEQSDANIVNLIEETCKRVSLKKPRKIGLLVSDGLKKQRLYDRYLKFYCKNAQIVYPQEEFQKLVTKGICNVKNKYRFTDSDNPNSPQYIFKTQLSHDAKL